MSHLLKSVEDGVMKIAPHRLFAQALVMAGKLRER